MAMSAPCGRQQGFSLIEVLVALTIISIGLLGIVGLQTHTQKVSSNAYYQTQSIIITHDMAEKIHANPIASYQKQYHLKQPLRSANCHKQTGCSPYSMAKNDLFEWHEIINQQLPQGAGVVCIDSTPNDGKPNVPACDNQGAYYAIKLWWYDSSVNKILRSVMRVRSE
jgi:type IV pilus assembly protein PilV